MRGHPVLVDLDDGRGSPAPTPEVEQWTVREDLPRPVPDLDAVGVKPEVAPADLAHRHPRHRPDKPHNGCRRTAVDNSEPKKPCFPHPTLPAGLHRGRGDARWREAPLRHHPGWKTLIVRLVPTGWRAFTLDGGSRRRGPVHGPVADPGVRGRESLSPLTSRVGIARSRSRRASMCRPDSERCPA